MVSRTIEAVLHPDGRIALAAEALPDHPVRVAITFLEESGEAALSEENDYLEQLTEYEERLARGEIRWQ